MFKTILFSNMHCYVKNLSFFSNVRKAAFLLFFALFGNLNGQVSFTGSSTLDFDGYTGAGFASSPAADQLDSDDWAIDGLSDSPDMDFGDTETAGDFAPELLTENIANSYLPQFHRS